MNKIEEAERYQEFKLSMRRPTRDCNVAPRISAVLPPRSAGGRQEQNLRLVFVVTPNRNRH